MKALAQLLKHTLFGVHNIGRILLGTGRLTDGKMRERILTGKVEYPPTVDGDLCLGCGVCSRICPMKCITMKPLPERIMLRENQYKDKYPEIDAGKCIFCFQCHDNCPCWVVHHKPSAIHPRGIRMSGLKAQDLFRGEEVADA